MVVESSKMYQWSIKTLCVCAKVNLSSEEFTVLLASLVSLDLCQTSEVLQLFSQAVGLLQQLLNHPIVLLLLALLLGNHELKQKQAD